MTLDDVIIVICLPTIAFIIFAVMYSIGKSLDKIIKQSEVLLEMFKDHITFVKHWDVGDSITEAKVSLRGKRFKEALFSQYVQMILDYEDDLRYYERETEHLENRISMLTNIAKNNPQKDYTEPQEDYTESEFSPYVPDISGLNPTIQTFKNDEDYDLMWKTY